MKILLINNYHYLKGGSERAYLDMGKLLAEKGHEVAYFSVNRPENLSTPWAKYFVDGFDFDGKNSLIARLRIAGKILYNFQANKNLQRLIKNFKPDVAHLHNVYHHLSPAIVKVLKRNNLPVVLTLHDYKLFCPSRLFFQENKSEVCYACSGEKFYQCTLKRCVKNSRTKSFLLTLEAYLHRKILKSYEGVDVFISPSYFLRDLSVKNGLLTEKIIVVPHFVNVSKLEAGKISDPDLLLYFGRLSAEKGLIVLIEAMARIDKYYKLNIIGDGDKRKELEDLVEKLDLKDRIFFLGAKYGKELETELSRANTVIFPSLCLENSPYSVMESLVRGKRVIGSNLGGISEMLNDLKNSFLFAPGNSQDLAEKIKFSRNIEVNSEEIARESAIKYSDEKYYETIFSLYCSLIDNKKASITKITR